MRSRNKWSIEWFFKHKARNKNNKVTLSIGEQIFKALMSFVQVETMANITRHCKLNEIFKYNRASQYWNSNCRSKARAHALKSFPSFKIPNFPSRPATLFFGLVTWSRGSWSVVKVTVYPQCICPRYFDHERLYERILNEEIFIIIIPSLMAYPICWIINTELLDSAFVSWRITQIKEQDIKRLLWAHVAHSNFLLKLIGHFRASESLTSKMRPFPSFQNPHFQNEAKCKSFPMKSVSLTYTYMRFTYVHLYAIPICYNYMLDN